MFWLLLPFCAQGAAMFADEMIFHRKRGLPRWERIGHPLDTLTVVGAYLFALLGGGLVGYIVLAALSCLFVTKDEPVHSRLCTAGEQWLHAVQFVLHPIVFLCFAVLWRGGEHTTLLWMWLVATAGFGLYQFAYWSFIWSEPR